MAIAANCPGCKTTFQLSDSLVGKKVRCKKCGQAFMVGVEAGRELLSGDTAEIDIKEEGTIPSGSSPSGIRRLRDERFREEDAEERKRKEQQKALNRKILIYGGLGSVVLLFCALLIAGFHSMNSEDKNTKPRSTGPSEPPVVTPTSPVDAPSGRPLTPGGPTAPVAEKGARNPVIETPRKTSTTPPAAAAPQTVTAAPLAFDPPAEDEERPAPVPPAVKWKLTADPPSPAFKPVGVTRTPAVFARDQRVIVPTTPSAAIALGGGVGAGFVAQLLSLPSVKVGKSLTITTGLADPMALSPDGSQLAGWVSTPATKTVVDVWSFATQKRVRQITVEDRRVNLELLDFAQPGRLLVMMSDGGKRTLQVWDIAKGSKLLDWSGPAEYVAQTAALSPGRKYLAVGAGDRVFVYDLNAGSVAAEVSMPRSAKNAGKYECSGLAFAPDGAELAGIFDNSLTSRIVAWEVAKGNVAADHSFDRKFRADYKGPALEWLLGRSGWLVYGKTLLEHDTGRLLWEVPATGPERELRVLGRDRLLEIAYTARGNALSVTALPPALDVELQVTQRVWGTLNLPAASAADLTTVQAIAPPPDGLRWSYAPDGGSGRAEVSSRPIAIAQKESDVQRVLFTRPDVGQLALLSSAAPDERITKKVMRLDRYDAATGKHLDGGPLCADPQYRSAESAPLADLSPDGKMLALKGRQDRRRVDVWNLAESRHVAGWLPYAQLTPAARPGSAADSASWLALADAGRILTLNPSGKLVLWTLPGCRPVYALDNVLRGSLALSPGRKYLAVLQGGAFGVYLTATGEPVGKLPWPVPIDTGNPLLEGSVAFSRNGGQLAAVIGGKLVCWELRSGKETLSFPTCQDFTDLTWCGKDHLIGRSARTPDTVFLISLEQQCVLCGYRVGGGGCQAAVSPDGHVWVTQGGSRETTLAALTLPDARATGLAQSLDDPKVGRLVQPASANQAATRVSVRVDLRRGSDALRSTLNEHLSARLKSLGLEPDEGQGVVLTFQASVDETGEELTNDRAGGAPVAGPVKKLTCSVSFGSSQGQAWWQQETSTKASAAMVEQLCVYLADSLPIPNRVYVINGQVTVMPAAVPLAHEAGRKE